MIGFGIGNAVRIEAAIIAGFPGGAWHLHTEIFKAERDGNLKRLAKLEREERGMAELTGLVKKLIES
jgi:hypothetical protein